MPSRRISTSATASADGWRSGTTRHRDRIVTEMSSGCVDGVQSRNTVRGGGSSMALSSALAACSVSRSASSITTACQRPPEGAVPARRTSARISLTPMDRPSGTTKRTSAWVAPSTVWHPWHSPQPTPSRSHSSAAANARAATDRPDPGGPVKIQAWVIAPLPVAVPAAIAAADRAAARSVATASPWPTRSEKTWPITLTLVLRGSDRTSAAASDFVVVVLTQVPVIAGRRVAVPLRWRLVRARRAVVDVQQLGHLLQRVLLRLRDQIRLLETRPGRHSRRGRCRMGVVACQDHALDPFRHLAGDLLDRPGRVQHQIPLRVGGRQIEEGVPAPLVEAPRLALEPVGAQATGVHPAEPDVGVDVQQDDEVRLQTAGRPGGQPGDLLHRQG